MGHRLALALILKWDPAGLGTGARIENQPMRVEIPGTRYILWYF
jgi:hypothetical protein